MINSKGTAGQSGAGDHQWAKKVGNVIVAQERERHWRWLA